MINSNEHTQIIFFIYLKLVYLFQQINKKVKNQLIKEIKKNERVQLKSVGGNRLRKDDVAFTTS